MSESVSVERLVRLEEAQAFAERTVEQLSDEVLELNRRVAEISARLAQIERRLAESPSPGAEAEPGPEPE